MFDNGAQPPPLTPAAAAFFVDVVLRAAPSNSPILLFGLREAAAAAIGDADGAARDPRWAEAFRRPVLLAAVRWVGAGLALHSGRVDPDDGSFAGDGTPAAVLVGSLESWLQHLIKTELARFWREADAAKRGAGRTAPLALHTPANLALQWTLVFVATFAQIQAGRTVASLAVFRQFFDVARRMRVPGEDSCPLEGCSADDAPFLNIFVSVFWASVTAALNFTAASGIPSVVDVVAEFPTAPPPVAALQTAPALSQSSSTPVIHFTPPPFRALEYLGWIDPPDGLDPVPASSRALVLDRCLGGIKAENGLFLLNPLVAQLLQKISDYSSWLRNGAGLRQLDVLALVARSTNSDPQAVRSRDLYMAEALRRRTALLQAVELIDGALPADVSDAVDGADFVAIATAFSSSAPNALVLALAVLTKLKQLSLLLCCPDPFEDLVGAPEAPKEAGPRKRTDLLHRAPTGSDTESDVSSAPSVVSSESADLFSWLSSPAFAVASRSAAIIASIMRTVCERVPASELEANYLASHFLCTAAVHGAWFPLLLLRRFDALALSRSLGCRLPAESMKLHAELRSDAAACLSAMERCGLPQYQSARLILQSVLDGEDARFGLADIRVLRMASRVVAGCPHSGDVGQGGECYLCTAERARERRPSYRPPEARMDSDDEGGACERGEGGNATDPLADAAVLGASARRRVRFTGSDDVRDTWSASEYPGRSPTAGEEPDETDEGVLPAGPLGVLISQRKRAVGRAVGAEAAEMPWGD